MCFSVSINHVRPSINHVELPSSCNCTPQILQGNASIFLRQNYKTLAVSGPLLFLGGTSSLTPSFAQGLLLSSPSPLSYLWKQERLCYRSLILDDGLINCTLTEIQSHKYSPGFQPSICILFLLSSDVE